MGTAQLSAREESLAKENEAPFATPCASPPRHAGQSSAGAVWQSNTNKTTIPARTMKGFIAKQSDVKGEDRNRPKPGRRLDQPAEVEGYRVFPGMSVGPRHTVTKRFLGIAEELVTWLAPCTGRSSDHSGGGRAWRLLPAEAVFIVRITRVREMKGHTKKSLMFPFSVRMGLEATRLLLRPHLPLARVGGQCRNSWGLGTITTDSGP
jgi:hypothetical protein